MAEQKPKTIAVNRKARHDYQVFETFEAGIVLTGGEIKSVRNGRVQLRDGYAIIQNGEAWLENVHISPYEQAARDNPSPIRRRKLLLHRREINRLIGKTQEKGLTLIPMEVYLSRGRAKVKLALARGRRQYDKRRAIAEREMRLEVERARKKSLGFG
ncbi:MAG: SsrA-binding protein SmpB [Armatimonadetes bacterium]|nr:SsrA-binding protein SmpB [Armatimonadota bacterium]NIM23277.1 SsrA-binding protein SmpB [Armatimonadota bacterium]NIM67145.1 SsrA-binding protein SmpB [Armatimonadota bacterium]NIM75671.1 SsrA-binding protein SmpB [Armatimonadota bacterium]NIN05334.1 SsrA-binding protein SmpB [Armatimonadota bacterium]